MKRDMRAARLKAYAMSNATTSDRGWKLRALTTSIGAPTVTELYIYDFIDWLGVTAQDVVQELMMVNTDEILVRLNSPGGDVFDGIAIKNALSMHPATVRVSIDGIAASIASVIAMAGETITMQPGSQFMIHQASSMTYDNADGLRSLADLLEKQDLNIANIYAARVAGSTPADWLTAMKAETWYSDQEAVDAGLADALGAGKPEAAEAMTARFDLSVFAYAGRGKAPTPRAAMVTPACSCGPKGHKMVAKDGQHAAECPALGGLTPRPLNLPAPAGVNWEVVPFDGCCDICQDVVDGSPYAEDDLPDVPVHPNCDCELQVAYGVDNHADPFTTHFTSLVTAATDDADELVRQSIREAIA